MAKHEPKIIDAVESERHSDNRRSLIQPKTYAIDFAAGQSLDDCKPDTSLMKHSGDMARILWIAEQITHALDRGGELRWHIQRRRHLACNVVNAEKPRELCGRNVRVFGALGGMRKIRNLCQRIDIEEPAKL